VNFAVKIEAMNVVIPYADIIEYNVNLSQFLTVKLPNLKLGDRIWTHLHKTETPCILLSHSTHHLKILEIES